MTTYNAKVPKSLDATTPIENTYLVGELNDSIKEIKTVLGYVYNISTYTTLPVTMSELEGILLINVTSVGKITLPLISNASGTTPAGLIATKPFSFINIGTAPVMIYGKNTETVGNEPFITLYPGETITLCSSNTTNWNILNRTSNPTKMVNFFVDFLTTDTYAQDSPEIGAYIGEYFWWLKGTGKLVSDSLHSMLVESASATHKGLLLLRVFGAGSDVAKHFSVGKQLNLTVRWAQNGIAAGIRYIGLADDSVRTTVPPTNGIYFRHTLNGNITAVCRAAGVETVVALATTAASGTYHTGKLVVRETGGVDVVLDDVWQNTITSNVPTVNLAPAVWTDTIGAGTGLEVDYINIKQNR